MRRAQRTAARDTRRTSDASLQPPRSERAHRGRLSRRLGDHDAYGDPTADDQPASDRPEPPPRQHAATGVARRSPASRRGYEDPAAVAPEPAKSRDLGFGGRADASHSRAGRGDGFDIPLDL